jgi:hypothetical protein
MTATTLNPVHRVYARGMKHLATLGVPPPRDPHDRVQSGRFLRALLLRTLLLVLPAWVLIALLGVSAWLLIVGGVTLALIAVDVLWLSYRVRRDERRAGTS